jgi:hypothetical protein
MHNQSMKESEPGQNSEQTLNGVNRRTFLKYAGVTVGTGAVLLGCKDDDPDPAPATDNGVNLGSDDVGVLNYAYALEQLEAAFYTTVVAHASFMTTFPDASERTLLTEIRDHEIVHRDFLKAALGTNAIQDLEVDFSSINFMSRASVLGTAKVFEDLGVAAYNGAGKLLSDVNNLLVAGKIVSVEARHASAIRDLLSATPLNSKDFAGDDVVDTTNGLDRAFTPTQVLTAADPFIKTKINASNLPTA